MTVADRWLLPDGIEEILAPRARQAEMLRREMLDLFDCWGYELVIPPHLEFMESLTAGVGRDLELQTFKVTDQLTGRTMGLRADTTPAVARIDAHTLKAKGPVRLCYASSVFHTRSASLGATRSPIQLGAELYGHGGVESDIEVISLMLETLAAIGIESVNLDLGHVRIYRSLVEYAGLSEQQEQKLFDALQRKAECEVSELLASWQICSGTAKMFKALTSLTGHASVINDARALLKDAPEAVFKALDQLEVIAGKVAELYPSANLYLDMGELRGYNYHTGVVFAAYVPGKGQAIAKGGRYDGIGRIFGRARPATGFSTDLKTLIELKSLLGLNTDASDERMTIFAPVDADPAAVQKLRRQGQRVVYQLPEQETDAAGTGCDRQLVCRDGEWVVE
ncbi:ATP phosphoribosyltransferase regulatory subunit [Endozoicomonas sp. 8E]|uniref:ATP phosphoribosyltransferase regulatory subunit n=1 Tax=Endozoicomonas sp. 8E TaxID=3035692 RepID=UPI002939395C|nr:ATP phosphoribosyltransferase regulatory subunit [Endozoicomonas sp. 8E]WOG28539.1 ATP phosphoribosyltransferase regulatory subunit [Endozoicomonas sp. 8E]